MEYDGVVVEDTSDLQRKAWLKVAEEEAKSPPPQFALRRAEGMKNDQVCILQHWLTTLKMSHSCFLVADTLPFSKRLSGERSLILAKTH